MCGLEPLIGTSSSITHKSVINFISFYLIILQNNKERQIRDHTSVEMVGSWNIYIQMPQIKHLFRHSLTIPSISLIPFLVPFVPDNSSGT